MPFKFGNMNVVLPLPPYWVPMTEYSVVFCCICNVAPSQAAQLFGMNVPQKIRISPTNGSAMVCPLFLWSWWINALNGDTESERQIGLHIVVWLIAAGAADRRRVERGVGAGGIAGGEIAPGGIFG